MTTRDEQIEQNLAKPASASSDGVSASQHSLASQIQAAEYLDNKANNGSKKLPIRFAKIRPGGTNGTGG